jgi:mannose-6-phosphate isomerase-like protein (cupin superfamily)
MGRVIREPAEIQAAGTGGKIIREFIGRVNSGSSDVSIARMQSPQGWEEPAQKPEFDEYTIVLRGTVRIECPDGVFDVSAGETFIAERHAVVRYSTPHEGGAEYIAVCVPAFHPDTVHREDAPTGRTS